MSRAPDPRRALASGFLTSELKGMWLMLRTVALVLIAWWVIGVGIAMVVGRFIALADARRGSAAPPRHGGSAGERHA